MFDADIEPTKNLGAAISVAIEWICILLDAYWTQEFPHFSSFANVQDLHGKCCGDATLQMIQASISLSV